MDLNESRLLTLISWTFLLLFSIGCGNVSEDDTRLRSILYTPEIHENVDVFAADSLLFMDLTISAIQAYKKLLKVDRIDKPIKNYIKWKLINLSPDSVYKSQLLKELKKEKHHHPFSKIEEATFLLNNKQTHLEIDSLKLLLHSEIPNYYKGLASFQLYRYYDEVENKLDSGWHYLMKSHQCFLATNYITPMHQTCLEKITSYCTYKRKNLMAIRNANALFDLQKYYPEADNVDRARAFANRAFMMFREGDFNATMEEIESGLKLVDSQTHPEVFQSLMKSYLVVYMLQENDSLWHKTAMQIEKNIAFTHHDYIGMPRWYGQYFAQIEAYQKAIPYLETALTLERKTGNKHSARHSTLCFLLSLCHENLGNYSDAFNYMALNEGIDDGYEKNKMIDHIYNKDQYSFVSALRCADIYYSKYKKLLNTEDLLLTKVYLDVIDEKMFSQFKVTEENAILQFYLDHGQEFFHLGLDVHFTLFQQNKGAQELENFLHYSEMSKNSLMYRDFLTAQKENSISEVLSQKEFSLRASIKEERRKGLRNNHRFDQLIDDYTLVETEIENSYQPFVHQGLNQTKDISVELQKAWKDESSCLLVIDETQDYWYYTLIDQCVITVERLPISSQIIEQIDTMISYLSKKELSDDKKTFINYVQNEIIPNQIKSKLKQNIVFVPDGIFNRFPLSGLLAEKQFDIHYLPSVKLFRNQKVETANKGKAAIFSFSDPETIRSKTRTYLAELPGTYKEAIKIQKLIPNANLNTGTKATKANFLKAYQNPEVDYIHLALHGVANSSEKDEVKLYFRTDSGGLDSLYGYELLRYRSKVKKVVLSACQSGLGAYINGEGSYSLPRYFMINGATDVVFNYWDVED